MSDETTDAFPYTDEQLMAAGKDPWTEAIARMVRIDHLRYSEAAEVTGMPMDRVIQYQMLSILSAIRNQLMGINPNPTPVVFCNPPASREEWEE